MALGDVEEAGKYTRCTNDVTVSNNNNGDQLTSHKDIIYIAEFFLGI